MSVHKTTSKAGKKTSKLESLKKLVFGGSSARTTSSQSQKKATKQLGKQSKDGQSTLTSSKATSQLRDGGNVKSTSVASKKKKVSGSPRKQALAKSSLSGSTKLVKKAAEPAQGKKSLSRGSAPAKGVKAVSGGGKSVPAKASVQPSLEGKHLAAKKNEKVKVAAEVPASQPKSKRKEKSKVMLSSAAREVRSSNGAMPHFTLESVCREVACEGLSTSGGYCRLHYIKNWKKIKRKELILREKKLNQYIEELIAKYPDKYIEAIRQDLASDKEFAKVIYDLDLDESIDDFDIEGGESVDSLIDSIKRDFDDEGDSY